MFSGGVDINVIKNESVEATETGKVGCGVGQMEEDQIGSEMGASAEGVDFRASEQHVQKESLEGGNIATVVVKTEKVEDEDDDDDDDEEEEEDDDSDENDDDEEEDEEEEEGEDDDSDGNEINDKKRKSLPCDSLETEHGETKKFKEDINEKPEVV
jgi:hypothetical protein